MDITILCSSKEHPIYPHIIEWANLNSKKHNISVVNKSQEVTNGDILFLISCTEMIGKNIRDNFKHTLVIHESDLPSGRGWSPIIWQIIEGRDTITITLFNAVDKVDAGDVWTKEVIHIENHEMIDEINNKLFPTKLKLVDFAIENMDKIIPTPQSKIGSSNYPRRNPEDSKLDINKSIVEQFDLLRVVDKKRYPCFIEYRGHRYKINMEKF